jgi:cytochrome c peroxidase
MRPGCLALIGLSFTLMAGLRAPAQEGYDWQTPRGFPAPRVPADNPMSAAKVDAGRHLFYDTRLSANRTQSCASCHDQRRAFTDGLPRSVGSTGQRHPRGSMSLVNVAYASMLTWADPTQTRLEQQALVPMYTDHPIELGLDRTDRWLDALARDRTYQGLFRAAFPGDRQPITRDNVVKALAAFERSIVSARSPYDRYHFDRDDTAISEAAKRGEVLFHSRPLSCFTCHGGVHFSSAMGTPMNGMTNGAARVELHNTGLYNLPGILSYPASNPGLYETTHDPKDVGKFKPPTLRNIAVTAPYMHDGSIATLDEAIEHYAAGGRTIAEGEYKGVGRDNPNKSAAIRGFSLTSEQRADLIAFLEALTDEPLLRDPRFANPWPGGNPR